jgi:hypothetical protein
VGVLGLLGCRVYCRVGVNSSVTGVTSGCAGSAGM